MTVREMEKHLTPAEVYEARPKNFWTRILIGAVLLILVVWSAQGIKYNGIAAKGSEVAYGVFYGLVHPDQALLFNFTSEGVTYLTLQTIAIAVLGTVFGAILAIPVSFLSAENVVPKWLAFLFRALVLLIRTIPSLVWALVWIRVTGPGPFCGVVTQSICSIGMSLTSSRSTTSPSSADSVQKSHCSLHPAVRRGFSAADEKSGESRQIGQLAECI